MTSPSYSTLPNPHRICTSQDRPALTRSGRKCHTLQSGLDGYLDTKMSENRSLPNILVTGTPGVGKSTTCEQLSEATGLQWLNVSEIAQQTDCLDEFDPQYGCRILNEDKLLDELEPRVSAGGNIVEYHGCDFFPERWFDIVFVLRTDNKLLYDRLTKRGYAGKKLEDNVQCEIFQTLLDEARGAYPSAIVHELASNTPEQMEENVERICQWLAAWKVDHGVA